MLTNVSLRHLTSEKYHADQAPLIADEKGIKYEVRFKCPAGPLVSSECNVMCTNCCQNIFSSTTIVQVMTSGSIVRV